MTQVVTWRITTKGGAHIAFTTVGFENTQAAVEKWIGHGHHVKADWGWK